MEVLAMDQGLVSLVNKGVNYALSHIRKHYEGNCCVERNLPCHICPHTLDVVRRGTANGYAMSVTPRELQLGVLAAAFHDIVVAWHARSVPVSADEDHSINNELNSAQQLIIWLAHHDARRIVSESDKALMKEAIMATFTVWDQERHTAVQPYLTADSHPVARCLALADLGTAGMDGSAFLMEGDLRFRERYPDIDVAADNAAKYLMPIPLGAQEEYKARMLGWLNMQEQFIEGRRGRLEIELGNIPESSKECVRKLFCRFDEARWAVRQAIELRRKQSFKGIANAMGYDIPWQ